MTEAELEEAVELLDLLKAARGAVVIRLSGREQEYYLDEPVWTMVQDFIVQHATNRLTELGVELEPES